MKMWPPEYFPQEGRGTVLIGRDGGDVGEFRYKSI